jgi:catechol 2,3-dioxygenase-like lactoylglutathione lyase family enzyme
MPIELNHTIVATRNKHDSATFLTELLGLDAPVAFDPFLVVEVANGVSLDYLDHDGPITPQHYAFLVTETEFDEIFGRIQQHALPYWADPAKQHPQQINTEEEGRGIYWEDPDGHLLEILTAAPDLRDRSSDPG